MNINKEKYKQFCNSDFYIPIFSQYWWLNAICKDNWDVILIEEDNRVIASLSYYFQSTDDGKIEIKKATLTQNNGLFIKYNNNIKYEKKISVERKIIRMIIDELEKLPLVKYKQYFHYSFTNWLPFYWQNYSQTTRYTYIIENTNDMTEIELNFNSKLRNQIRKAKSLVDIREDMTIETFYEFNRKTFSRQNIEIPYSFEVVKNIDEACSVRNAKKIYYAIDKLGNIHSAVYFIIDQQSVYYLMSGSDSNFRDSQSLSLLIYYGIKLANTLGKKFDFEGSMKENLERNFSQFGAIQKPYFCIYKDYNI